MNLDNIVRGFVAESRELLDGMERDLLAAESATLDAETLNSIFRAAHTIKGGAGLFGLPHVVAFTHLVESVLDALRDGRATLDSELVALLLSCRDFIGLLIDSAEAGEVSPKEEQAQVGRELLEQLRAYLPTLAEPGSEPPTPAAESPSIVAGDPLLAPIASNHWHISLRFGPDVLRGGMDPLSFIRYLSSLGTISGIVTVFDQMPSAEQMDPESCYLGFEIALSSEADKTTLESVFDFVRDSSSIRILPPNSRIAEFTKLIAELPEAADRLGEILQRCGTLTERELDAALAVQQAELPIARPLGEILIQRGSVHPEVVEAALAKQQLVIDHGRSQENRTIRVDSDKLDRLINLVGELIISAASTEVVARRARMPELQACTATLSHLVEEVRDSALQLRMVKIGSTFNRFQRVVHDVSRATGKDIALVVNGEETELDKTVVEQLGDPLLHLVRNAMDHGIESGELREQRGKPTRGTVKLNAFHDSGNIVIEVSDDGGGLRCDKIRAKAVERGLIEATAELSENEIFSLIFEPGFSTAEQVTDLSGRGVGMDVVKRNITALRGSVSIASQEGIGTTVTVRLPLTLAIINGFLVGLGNAVFVLPLDVIEECVELSAEPAHDYTNLRGQLLPFIRLRELFGIEGTPGPRQNIVIVKHGATRAGLVVDTLLGEFQTVIKPLNKMFNQVKCINGSSILGSGEVALILDVPTLVRQAAQVSTNN